MFNTESGLIFRFNRLLMLQYYETVTLFTFIIHFQKRWEYILILVSAAVLPNKHNQ